MCGAFTAKRFIAPSKSYAKLHLKLLHNVRLSCHGCESFRDKLKRVFFIWVETLLTKMTRRWWKYNKEEMMASTLLLQLYSWMFDIIMMALVPLGKTENGNFCSASCSHSLLAFSLLKIQHRFQLAMPIIIKVAKCLSDYFISISCF